MTTPYERYLEPPDEGLDDCSGCEPCDVEWSEKWNEWVTTGPIIIKNCTMHDPEGEREDTVLHLPVTQNSPRSLD